MQVDKLNLCTAQTESSSNVLGFAILCCTFQDGKEKLHFCVCYANITPSTLHHFDSSEPSGNQQDYSDAKKIMSEGCFIHHLVTEVEPAWSNCICIEPCPYPTIVRYKSKYFNFRIILLSTWYQNLFTLRGCEVLQYACVWVTTRSEARRPSKHRWNCVILFPHSCRRFL